MHDGGVPVGLGDAHTLMGRLHVAPRVYAWAAGGGADEVNDVLADFLEGVLAVADEEAGELLVRGQAGDEVIGHGGDGVVSAEALVERRPLRSVGGHGWGGDEGPGEEDREAPPWEPPRCRI